MALGRTSFFLIVLHLINTLSAENIVNHETNDNQGHQNSESEIKAEDWYHYQANGNKRAPMGFVGMRGKKHYSTLYNPGYELIPKMQGSLIGEMDYSVDQSDQNQPNFPVLNELLNEYLQKLKDSGIQANEIQKRDFYAVRGKKSAGQNKRPYDLTFRGKFIGVRGKKDGSDFSNEQYEGSVLYPKETYAKRKSQVGFLGMRGKKWTDDSSFETEDQN